MEPARLKPLQQIKRVYGLGTDAVRNLDLTLIEHSANLSLAAMDAPDALPAGSMVSEDSYGYPRICERVTFRDYRPEWRQGGESWENGRKIHRMRDMQP